MLADAVPASTPTPLPPRTHLRAVAPAPVPTDFAVRAASEGISLEGPLVNGPLMVDLSSYVVTVDGTPVELSARQVELLALFLADPRRVWSREQLDRVCWGDRVPSRRVDVQLCRLRGKTGLDLFRNVRDRGWALRKL